jgi:hypothetical protein
MPMLVLVFQELDDAGWHVARLHTEEAKIRNRLSKAQMINERIVKLDHAVTPARPLEERVMTVSPRRHGRERLAPDLTKISSHCPVRCRLRVAAHFDVGGGNEISACSQVSLLVGFCSCSSGLFASPAPGV